MCKERPGALKVSVLILQENLGGTFRCRVTSEAELLVWSCERGGGVVSSTSFTGAWAPRPLSSLEKQRK